MARRKSKQVEVTEVSEPFPLSRDELGSMSLDQLEELRSKLELERQVVIDNYTADPRPWEVELSYVERALDDRRRYEAITPRSMWN
jgi:hypothetical protein